MFPQLIATVLSEAASLEVLDLGFNRLTDAGVHLLLKALAGSTALELQRLYLGGNRVSVAGMALSQNLKQSRPDLLVNWMVQLPNGKSMCTVGAVFAGSPARKAGLVTGDSVVAFGPVQFEDYKGVSESIVPVVKSCVGKPIDVVVVPQEDGSLRSTPFHVRFGKLQLLKPQSVVVAAHSCQPPQKKCWWPRIARRRVGRAPPRRRRAGYCVARHDAAAAPALLVEYAAAGFSPRCSTVAAAPTRWVRSAKEIGRGGQSAAPHRRRLDHVRGQPENI